MDIKHAVNSILPPGPKVVNKIEKGIKSDSAGDRDPNGQASYGQHKDHPQREMNDEEIQKALEHLRGLAVVKEHNLTIELLLQGDRKFVLVKDPAGKIVRRIPSIELWTLQIVQTSEKGQLLNKSA